MSYYHLHQERIDTLIRQALQEDIGDGDHTTLATLAPGQLGNAVVTLKQPGFIAGLEAARAIYRILDPDLVFTTHYSDGAEAQTGTVLFEVSGSMASITMGERLVLNTVQRMSGIATKTKRLTRLIAHTNTQILDTRKTTPNFRIFEKWAVYLGGGTNHRFGLYDAILLKDNHVDFAGSMGEALKRTKAYIDEKQWDLPVIVEVRHLDDIHLCLAHPWINRLLLDNMTPEMVQKAVALIDGAFETEVSGSVDEHNIADYAAQGVDYVSVGALTHQIKSLDMSMTVKKSAL